MLCDFYLRYANRDLPIGGFGIAKASAIVAPTAAKLSESSSS